MDIDPGFDLSGRRALITGAGQGVGAGIAARLAAHGAEVLVNDLVPERAAAYADALRAEGGNANPCAFDVTDHGAAVAAIADAGGVDILVNNAGNGGGDGWPGMKAFVDTTPPEWDTFLRVNLYGVMNCVHAVLPSMIKGRWGRIVTIISDAARVGEPMMAAYAAAKAGAAGLTRSIANENGRFGITANNISLGSMRTPLSEARWSTVEDPSKDPAMKGYAIRRPGLPTDVGALSLYLTSPSAEWITGQTIPLNGGYSVSL